MRKTVSNALGWADRHLRPLLATDYARRTFRFIVIGLVATATYFLCATALHYFEFLSVLAANTVAFVVSVLVSYIGHHSFTFQVQGRHEFHFPRFVIVTLALFLISSALIVLLVDYLELSKYLATTVVAVMYPVASFTLHQIWTFSAAKTRFH